MRQRHLLGALILAGAVVAGCGGAPVSQSSTTPTVDPAEASSLLNSLPEGGEPSTAQPKARPLPAGCGVLTQDDLKNLLGLTGFDQQQNAQSETGGLVLAGCTYTLTRTTPTLMSVGINVTAYDATATGGETLATALDSAIPCPTGRVPVSGVWQSGTQCSDGIAVASKLGGDYRILSIEENDAGGASGIQWSTKLPELAGTAFPRLL